MGVTTRNYLNPQSFVQGFREIDAGDFATFFNSEQSAVSGLVAHAGGGAALATPLIGALNTVATVASDNDSVLLPPAIPGLKVWVDNEGGHTLSVYAQTANPANAGAADQMVAPASTALAASLTQATGVACWYVCSAIGVWKQGAVS